jgi:FAD/FMN-containing dehydrogenase
LILSGWGRHPRIDANICAPRSLEEMRSLLGSGDAIARGNGRAYGDSAINVNNTIHMRHFNRLLGFDSKRGRLEVEAGVLLSDIIDIFMPQGWFPYVTPGTKFVTVGGMIASDVHGKNHHKEGNFANFVDWFDLVTESGSVVRCSRDQNKDFFEWTLGGMGLTGIILRAGIRLRPIKSVWMKQRRLVAENIGRAIEIFENSQDATYSVAWIDCLQKGKSIGRSLVSLAEHAETQELPEKLQSKPFRLPGKRKLRIPLELPSWTLNNLSVRAFNSLYFSYGKMKPKDQFVDLDSYFYPLDTILDWNKIYGRKGFVQFQCVIPLSNAEAGITELLQTIANFGGGSFLAVLKRFSKQRSRFSFPMEGYTLALDFPLNGSTSSLIETLDYITLKNNGRFYLAKDSRMSRETFMDSDPRIDAFKKFRRVNGMTKKFISVQSERLGL